MCGVLGTFGNGYGGEEVVRKALDGLSHRGPDHQAVLSGDGFCFGHTLLSIIGDSPIKQPVTSQDGSWSLTFNGEIYNYPEIAEEDHDLAVRSQMRSDTLILVEGLAKHGIEFVEKLNGIFAFAAFDHSNNVGYLVRDRLGIKPIYYASNSDGLVFSSETKPIRTYFQDCDTDPESMYSYVRFRYPIGERSFFKQIKMLPPATIMEVRDGQPSTMTSYWKVNVEPSFEGSYEEAREQVRHLLHDSIRIQMRSDHSFCTYLSGGLDSSYLTAIAATNIDVLDTYSIGVSDATDDESSYAALVAEHCRTRHHPYKLGATEYASELRDWGKTQGEPIGVPNQVALKILSRELSRDHRCVLSGEGADELFAGYGRIFQLPHDWNRYADSQTGGAQSPAFLAAFSKRYGHGPWNSYTDFFIDRYSYLSHNQATEVLRPFYSNETLGELRGVIESDVRTAFGPLQDDLFSQQLSFFQRVHLPGLLIRLDVSTMAHSVEGRVPFLDHRLVDFVNTLPFNYKQVRKPSFNSPEAAALLADELSEAHDIPKSILKDLGDELLPEPIVWRRKQGFPIPPTYYGSRDNEPAYLTWMRANLTQLEVERHPVRKAV